jgi:hypothetical protein
MLQGINMNEKKLERREIVGGIIVSLQIIENGYFMCYFGFHARHNPRFELVENLDTTYPSLQSKSKLLDGQPRDGVIPFEGRRRMCAST